MKDLKDLENSIAYLKLYAADPRVEKIENIGTATGFIWKRNGLLFLVTNWHVFTQKNQDTGEDIGSKEGPPRYIEIHLPRRRQMIESLFLESGEKRWLQSSRLKTNSKDAPESDIAVLPLEQPIQEDPVCAFNDVLEDNSARKDILLEVTMPVSIIGFPLGEKEGLCWVTGKVAQSLNESRPTFLVNAYPYSGMSGAPVLWVYPNRPIKLRNGTMVNGSSGTSVQFVGVYSGRMYEKHTSTSIVPLARVWSPSLIDDILSSDDIPKKWPIQNHLSRLHNGEC